MEIDENNDRGAPIPAKERNASYRQRMRTDGLRLIQMWVPDVEVLGDEVARQSKLISSNTDDLATLDIIEDVADLSE